MPSGTPQRPDLAHRTSSTGSNQVTPHSLSDASSSHRPLHRPRHVVGGGAARLGAARNTSFGNLNKLGSKLHLNNDAHGRKQHKVADVARSSSPRPALKRNSTTGAQTATNNASHLRKNYSSGHLPRHGSSKALNKHVAHTGRRVLAPKTKRTRSHQSDKSDKSETSNMTADDEDEVEVEVDVDTETDRTSPAPVQAPHTVRFDLGPGGNDQEDEWTEESGTASPLTTRDHTRQSSVSGEAGYRLGRDSRREMGQADEPPLSGGRQADSSSSEVSPSNKGRDPSYHSSRPLDPEDITSRLLQGGTTKSAGTSISNISVIADHAPNSPAHDLSRSLASPAVMPEGTPGRDLVSRFIHSNGASAVGTPVNASLNSQHQPNSGESSTGGQVKRARFAETIKRNQSMPAMAAEKSLGASGNSSSTTLVSTSSDPRARRPGPGAPNVHPPSRTEQKLMLQRASSTIETQKHLPTLIPRPGAPPLFGHQAGLALGSERLIGQGDAGPMSVQIQALFQEATKEYLVVRRFRVPVGESLRRLAKRGIVPKSSASSTAPSTSAGTTPKQGRVPPPDSDAGVKSAKETLKDKEAQMLQQQQQQQSQARSSRPPSLRQPSAPALSHRPQDVSEVNNRPAPLNRAQTHQQSRNRVSFELPDPTTPRTLSRRNSHHSLLEEEEEEDDDPESSLMNDQSEEPTKRDEAFEICQRLWEGQMDDSMIMEQRNGADDTSSMGNANRPRDAHLATTRASNSMQNMHSNNAGSNSMPQQQYENGVLARQQQQLMLQQQQQMRHQTQHAGGSNAVNSGGVNANLVMPGQAHAGGSGQNHRQQQQQHYTQQQMTGSPTQESRRSTQTDPHRGPSVLVTHPTNEDVG